jgi:hypothetical protein
MSALSWWYFPRPALHFHQINDRIHNFSEFRAQGEMEFERVQIILPLAKIAFIVYLKNDTLDSNNKKYD